ncbi:hypothetical protein ACFLWA_03795 [Chloroflexota bacterium]
MAKVTFDKAGYEGSELFEALRQGQQAPVNGSAAVLEGRLFAVTYTNKDDRESEKEIVPLYPFVKFDRRTGEVFEYVAVHTEATEYTDGNGRSGTIVQVMVGSTQLALSRIEEPAEIGGLRIESEDGETAMYIYPQKDHMAGWGVYKVEALKADELEEKLAKGYGYEPQFLATPARTPVKTTRIS